MSKEDHAPLSLTAMERRALLGSQALSREMYARHAEEAAAAQSDLLAMLREIAVAHGLADQAFQGEYGINMQTLEIIPAAPPEEITPATENADLVAESS